MLVIKLDNVMISPDSAQAKCKASGDFFQSSLAYIHIYCIPPANRNHFWLRTADISPRCVTPHKKNISATSLQNQKKEYTFEKNIFV
jgi:hypothetical protein